MTATRSWVWIVSVIGGVGLAASLILGRVAAKIPSIPDNRWAFNHAFGLGLPIRVVNDAPAHGAEFLAVLWLMVAAIAVCAYALGKVQWPDDRRSIRGVLVAQAIVCLVFSFFSVLVSSDVYAYVLWGRLYGLYAINPYAIGHVVGFQHDPVLQTLLTYFGNPPPNVDYGPLWVLCAGLLARLESSAPLAIQVWSHRAVAVLAAVLTSLAMCRILRAHPPAAIARRIAAFAFHPIVLFEAAAGGHNDMAMVALAAWAFALVDELPVVAGLLLGASMSVKYLAVLVAPFLLLRAAKRGPASAMLAALAAISVTALFFKPFWIDIATFEGIVGHAGVVTMSASWLVILGIEKILAVPVISVTLHNALEWSILVCLMLYLIVVSVRYAIFPAASRIWSAITATLWALPALNPWYVTWLSPALSSSGRWRTYAWWLGLAVFLHYRLDVIRRPPTAEGYAHMVFVLVVLTIVILLVPIALAMLESAPKRQIAASQPQ